MVKRVLITGANKGIGFAISRRCLLDHEDTVVILGSRSIERGKAAIEALDAGAADAAFYETKIATGRYYMARRLPATKLHLARIETGADTVMALDAASF